MIYAQPRDGREAKRCSGRKQGGDRPVSLWDGENTLHQRLYRPSGEGRERRIYAPKGPETLPQQQPGYYMYGQQRLPLPPSRTTSPGWHEDEGSPLADSDTLPARWRNEAQPAQKETRDANQGQQTAETTKVNFQRLSERRRDDRDQGSESSLGNSLEGSVANIEKDEGKPDDRSRGFSCYIDAFDYEGPSSGDENGYVLVSRGSGRSRSP